MEFTLELAAGLPNDGVFEAAPVVLEEPDIALFNLAAPLDRGSALQVRHSSYLRLPALR